MMSSRICFPFSALAFAGLPWTPVFVQRPQKSLKQTAVVLSEVIVRPTRSLSATALSIYTRSRAKCEVEQSSRIACAALCPGAPVTSPPGCVPAPQR